MADKPKFASQYKSEQVELVRSTCLYVATKLGDMMDDLLIVGGLVPSLIVDQEHLGDDVEPHVGTMDLDVGLQVALLQEGRYRNLRGVSEIPCFLTGPCSSKQRKRRATWHPSTDPRSRVKSLKNS